MYGTCVWVPGSPFPVHSFPQSHGPYPHPFVWQSYLGSLPSSLHPAVLPWVGVIRSTPLLCGE